MIIEFKASPSNFVLLSYNVSHLQTFEVRHCLNPHAKKLYITQDVLKSLKFDHVDLDCARLQKPVSEKHYLTEEQNCLEWFVTQFSLHLYYKIFCMCNDKILVYR